jgi:hypothetical protein
MSESADAVPETTLARPDDPPKRMRRPRGVRHYRKKRPPHRRPVLVGRHDAGAIDRFTREEHARMDAMDLTVTLATNARIRLERQAHDGNVGALIQLYRQHNLRLPLVEERLRDKGVTLPAWAVGLHGGA